MKNLLESDHRELDELLDKVFAAFEAADAGLAFQILDFFWARLAMHIRAEHLHLFPAVARTFGAQDVIEQLKDDHNFFIRELSGAVKEMRDLTENDQAGLSKRLFETREKIYVLSRRLEKHNRSEEAKIYNFVDKLPCPAERAEIEERIKSELNNLPPRFSSQNFCQR